RRETARRPPRPSRRPALPGRRLSPEDQMSERVRDVVVIVQLISHRRMTIAFVAVAVALGDRGDLAEVLVSDLLLRVSNLEETLPCDVGLCLGQLDAQTSQAVTERVASRPSGQDDA